jgi:hypothetical protein
MFHDLCYLPREGLACAAHVPTVRRTPLATTRLLITARRRFTVAAEESDANVESGATSVSLSAWG